MGTSMRFYGFLLFLLCSVTIAANAQSDLDDIGPLPTALYVEQLQLVPLLSSAAQSEQPKPRVRRRLPRPLFSLTPEEMSYREAVRKLGVNPHQFVHCELPNGKVRTGVITEIRDNGFTLKDGIIIAQWIPYTDLKAAPRPVAAVGTRIGQGFKWVGVGLGVAALIPLLPFAFLVWDGC